MLRKILYVTRGMVDQEKIAQILTTAAARLAYLQGKKVSELLRDFAFMAESEDR